MSDLLKSHIENVLEANYATVSKTLQRVEELEAEGRRVIIGGQIGEDAWDIIDWRTNEILAAGTDGLAGYAVAGTELDPDGTWIHLDQILEEEDPEYVETPGLPEGLAATIEDWVLTGDPEEIAAFIGWPLEKVEEYQAEA
ncbi:hypothetical protein FHR83_003757 [Actinoplanes campanulatus]|uniref:Uncharacterized protein n=1 Tax=Actinoplanes campanulatus TaxID=113559 RepID=A0A7W5FF84_9ACTN|nr:hypothetical protein [Actinoplanes campanulatus]MBB3096087.1 hypothetical protein [Actinoplanes campanulatus]GGN13586.1 hypothetical protein GCM10010109_24710 [Actinoplanes campanulatus]GID36819.1 hypothetical protein Aca09nite_33250 [Actinoplanes campanulatus]